MNITENILKTIDYGIQKSIGNLSTMDSSGIITRIPENPATYEVMIQGEKYIIPNGSGISFKVGDLVWIHSPNGNFNKKYIISSRTPNSKSFDNAGSGEYGGGGTINPSDFATIEDIDAMFL